MSWLNYSGIIYSFCRLSRSNVFVLNTDSKLCLKQHLTYSIILFKWWTLWLSALMCSLLPLIPELCGLCVLSFWSVKQEKRFLSIRKLHSSLLEWKSYNITRNEQSLSLLAGVTLDPFKTSWWIYSYINSFMQGTTQNEREEVPTTRDDYNSLSLLKNRPYILC